MLVLSRRERERVRLGESIVVTIVRVSGDKVRLGIEAPADVLVLRDELEAQAPPATVLEVELDASLSPAVAPKAALVSMAR